MTEEELIAYKKRWYLKNRIKRLSQEKERRGNLVFAANKLYQRAKANAKRRNIEFNLDFSDIVVPEKCPIFPWLKLTAISGEGFVDTNISLDRIDSTKGYIKGNVQVISYKANRNKNNSSLKELMALGKWARRVSKTNN